MLKQTTAAKIVSSKWKLFALVFLALLLLLMIIISIYLCFCSQASSKLIIRSTDSLSSSSSIMNKYMHGLYNEINISKRRKRQLSNDFHSIISLFNSQNRTNSYAFQYNSTLENLTAIELILPVKKRTANTSSIEIQSNQFHRFLQAPFRINDTLLKIDLTKSVQRFPLEFSITLNNISLESSGFLTLYFHEKKISHSKKRRDLSLLDNDPRIITYPENPSYCQVHRYRTSFADLNWTSWILEPTSYEMNLCSGHCQPSSQMPSYLTMQNLLHQSFPQDIPSLCCKPKRFAPTMLLYYDGPNLILKRYENMRVIECGCS